MKTALEGRVTTNGTIPDGTGPLATADRTVGFDNWSFDKIFAGAQPDSVFGAPIIAGPYTIITAAETFSAGGLGFGQSPAMGGPPMGASVPNQGGGGGGMATSRPIAVIVAGPDGVQIRPVLDLTKIALTGIAAWRFLMGMVRPMRLLRRRALPGGKESELLK
jgi:uncharacterized spore protein YtfJ